MDEFNNERISGSDSGSSSELELELDSFELYDIVKKSRAIDEEQAIQEREAQKELQLQLNIQEESDGFILPTQEVFIFAFKSIFPKCILLNLEILICLCLHIFRSLKRRLINLLIFLVVEGE